MSLFPRDEVNILMVTASMSRNSGGIFHSVRSLSHQLAVTCIVKVVSLRDRFSVADVDTWRPLSPEPFDPVGPRQWGYSPALRKRIRRDGANIVHACGLWMYPSYAAASACRRKKLPLVISPHGMLDPWALKNSAWKKKIAGWLFENRNFRFASCIHALCESEYESIRRYGLKNPIAIIPNGIDLPQEGSKLPAPWVNSISLGRKIMLFLGRLHPKKGLSNLIEAWAQLKVKDKALADEWRLVIAGWSQGGHEEQLKKTVAEKELEHDVIFLGPVFDDTKRACFQNADTFILPSFSEGLPMCILEAWSYGLPVIMTGECNIPEGFQAGAAIVIQPQTDSVTEGLGKLLSMSDADRRQMGWNGRNLVASKFSWPTIAAQMIDVYQWCLGQGPQPNCVRLN